MRHRQIHKGLLLAMPAVLMLLLWQLSVASSERREFLLGSPYTVLRVALKDLATAALWHDIALTSSEMLLGLLVGSVLGTLCGLVMWWNERVAEIARPYVIMLGSIPVFAIAPILIIWFGTGLTSKIILAGFSTALVALVQAYEGARGVRGEYVQLARSFQASRWLLLRKIVFPAALSWVLVGYKLNVGFALIGAFVGEFISSDAGLGHYILRASGLYDVPRVLFGIALLALIALGVTALVTLIERFWFPWCRRGTGAEPQA